MSELSREQMLSALRWLVEAGADEAISEAPINRLVASGRARPGTEFEPRSAPPGNVQSLLRPTGASPPQKEEERRSARAEAVSLSTAPGAARALAASCANLSELKAALMRFDGCELKRTATNTVFADGNPEGGIMFIGEAPGRDEDEQGLPFVGRAGKLLDLMLASIGLDRKKVYITNVINWRPPQNREPTPEEAAACLPFLHRHIELANPRLLVLLGAVSVRHVLGLNEGIMRLRGRWQDYQCAPLGRAIPTLPTLHPAFLLRQSSAKRLAWRDLLAISEKMDELGLA